jgi:hypothetical protein
MYSNGSSPQHLSKGECLRLMASVPVGRIIYTRQALPAVDLVNFTLDRGDIIIRTDRSAKLAAATRAAVVAFEADSLDASGQVGWSVTVIGHSHEVTDADEISRLEQTGLSSWAPGEPQNFIRISPGILTGWQLCALTDGQPTVRHYPRPRGTRHSSLVPGADAAGSAGPSRSSPPSFSARAARLRSPLRLPSGGSPIPLSAT